MDLFAGPGFPTEPPSSGEGVGLTKLLFLAPSSSGPETGGVDGAFLYLLALTPPPVQWKQGILILLSLPRESVGKIWPGNTICQFFLLLF